MLRADDASGQLARRCAGGEDVARNDLRHPFGQIRDIRHAASEHDHVRVEHVHESGERTAEAIAIETERHRGNRLASGGSANDLRGGGACTGATGMIALETWTRYPHLDATHA